MDSLESSKHFCMKPWVHLFVSHFGTVVPCCLTPWEHEKALGDINEQQLKDIWNGEKMREFRLKMLKDQPDNRCWQCYKNEEVGLRSTRNVTNFLYAGKLDWALKTAMDGSSAEARPITWDIRVSNLCNFKCRICGHHSSSQWYDDAKALGLLSHDTRMHRGPKDFDLLMKQLDFVIDDLEEIYFAGGEPLIMEEHYRIIEMLLERGKTDIRLCYATNFSQTYYKGKDLFEYWAKFEDVNVFASLDGSEKRGELQRSGQSWQQAEDNRRRMLEKCPNVDFLITPTINIFNILHLPDFHKNWVERGLIKVDEFMPHTLKNPPEYNITILPAELKKQAEEKINAHINWIVEYVRQNAPAPPSPKKLEKIGGRLEWILAPEVTGHIKVDIMVNELKSAITYMNSQDDSGLMSEFKELSLKLDKLRGENTAEVFPELKSILE